MPVDTQEPTGAQAIWSQAVDSLRGRLPEYVQEGLSEIMRPVEIRDRLLVLDVPSGFFRDWLEGTYRSQMEEALRQVVGDTSFSLLIRAPAEPEAVPLPAVGQIEEIGPAPARPRPTLNSRYAFDRFVVGSTNKFAFAAAEAVAAAPGRAYNPLIIWGGVGLGKTHLLQAIGNAIASKDASVRIVCVNSEQFLNDMVRALADRTMMEFKAKYRQVDLLLLDDIQFLENKELSQEEFFHTFNELHESRRQVVATSDRHPSELSRLEERLRSRLQMGLVTDIAPPDYELRLAILRTKAKTESVPLPDDVAHFLAQAREANVRELEGDFTTVVAYCSMHHVPLSVESAQSALRGRLSGSDRKITVELIQREVERVTGVPVPEQKGQARTADIVRARQMAMYLCRLLVAPTLPLSEIGARFGGRDHTTVLHSVNKTQALAETDPPFAEELQRLSKQIRALA